MPSQSIIFLNAIKYYLQSLYDDVACIQSDDRGKVNLSKSLPVNLIFGDYYVCLGRS